jgi:hypothetical protein
MQECGSVGMQMYGSVDVVRGRVEDVGEVQRMWKVQGAGCG